MRLLVPFLGLALLATGLALGARADEPAPPTAPEALLRRIELLETKVAYLASREQALTAHALRAQGIARDLSAALASARAEGFTSGAISAPSREALLGGLEDLARALPKDPPELTKEENVLLMKIKSAK